MTHRFFLLLTIIVSACTCAYARVTGLPITFSDNMVLQRDATLHFSGCAAPGERIHVALADIHAEVRANAAGKWSAALPAMPAGGPYELCIGDKHYHNIYIGEVWLCTGQSNMEFRLNQDADFRKNSKVLSDPNGPAPTSEEGLRLRADHDKLHLFNMRARWLTGAYRWSEEACDSTDRLLYFDTSRGWELCTSETAKSFSAIAYYFGRELADSLDCHVGLILNAVGGSTTESWIDHETLYTAQPQIFDNWSENPLVMQWVRGRAVQNVGNTGHRHPYQPCYLFDTGIEPLRQVAMRGAIWYQGESNADDVAEHEVLFPLMVKSWREALTCPDGDLPLYMVQLSSIAPRHTWPAFRDSQRRLAERISGVWMAISSDVGDSLDVHPRLKRPVGHRLAALALKNTYHKPVTGIMPYAPTSHELKKGRIFLKFGDAHPRFLHTPRKMFEVRDKEGRWQEAVPTVVGPTIRLDFTPLITPTAVRYGWQPFTRACVTNETEWPLSTFEIPLTNNE